MRGCTKKKLKHTVRDRFFRVSDIDVLLPPKVEIKVSKYQNRVLVYSIEEGGCPMFLDVDGRGKDIFPAGKKGLEVLGQGGVTENLAKHLIEQYGIPKRYIEVLDKIKRREVGKLHSC